MSQISLPPLGEVDVDLDTPRTGRLFQVFQASFEGRPLLIKTPRSQPGDTWTGEFSGIQTSLWWGTTAWSQAFPVLLDQLLVLECERIRASQGRWNHSVVGLGFWDAHWMMGEPGGWRAALAMPKHPGVSLSALPRREQRRLFPRLLPALLAAVRAAPHGDLTASNIVVDTERGRFALVDPGVTLWSRRPNRPSKRDLKPGMARGQRDRVAFTTTGAAYPLFPPQHCVPLGASWDQHLKGLAILKHTNPTVSSHRSAAADVFALGVLYFQLLTGSHPLPAYAQAPFWSGECGDTRDRFERQVELARLKKGLPAPSDLTSVHPDEDALCRRLLALQVDG